VITLWRRHLARCKYRSRRHKHCSCPIWAEGRVHNQKIRKSLDLTNWEAAIRLTREWEISSPQETSLVRDVCDRFLDDARTRNLREPTLRKYEHMGEELKKYLGDRTLRSISTSDLRIRQQGWKVAPITARKRLERLKTFFRFCMDSRWIQQNPARALKPPLMKDRPTLPFDSRDIEKIEWAIDTYKEVHERCPDAVLRKLRALILLLRYSGLRIHDAVTLKRSRIVKGRLFLYTQKTNTPVCLPLPDSVIHALQEADDGNDHYFWSGLGKPKSAITQWQERLKNVFEIAGIGGHAHRFRDTFAVNLLLKGIPLESVAVLLGHSSVKTTEKHYAPWVKARQEQLESSIKKIWAVR
jgi:integrase/recombinase XerD